MAVKSSLTANVVVDASFILALLLPDEEILKSLAKHIRAFEEGKIDFIAPTLLKYEVANGLRSAVLQKRLSRNTSYELINEFLKLPIIYKEINLA